MTQREDFVRCAQAQVGKRYVWATAGPNTFDCSGLVAYCYQQATGKTITRSSYDQIHLGTPVSPADFGDLMFWGHGQADHVGISLGNGMVANALNEQRGVVITPAKGEYGMPYMGARRIFLPADSPIVEEPAPVEEIPRPKRKRRHNRRKDRA